MLYGTSQPSKGSDSWRKMVFLLRSRNSAHNKLSESEAKQLLNLSQFFLNASNLSLQFVLQAAID